LVHLVASECVVCGVRDEAKETVDDIRIICSWSTLNLLLAPGEIMQEHGDNRTNAPEMCPADKF